MQIMCPPVLGIDGKGLADEADPRADMALLARDLCQIIKRIRMPWILAKNSPVSVDGVVKRALPTKRVGLLQQAHQGRPGSTHVAFLPAHTMIV
jgi:hypothetical protein